MPTKKQIEPGEAVSLRLTATERELVLQHLLCLESDLVRMIREAPNGKPVLISLDDLELLSGHVAAAANYTKDKEGRCSLDIIFERIEEILATYSEVE